MMASIAWLKRILPNREINLRILRGPLRGGMFHARPQVSMRKVFGLYEHELNSWLTIVLPKIDLVIDVGANDGYFTFGCAAAMRRSEKAPRIIAFEPNTFHVRQLEQARGATNLSEASIQIVPRVVGREATSDIVTLDQFVMERESRGRALVKIDVEGAELDVLAGGQTWLRPSNFFLIEIHKFDYLKTVLEMFSSAGIQLQQIDQKPLPLLGRETRDVANWWLVTDLTKSE